MVESVALFWIHSWISYIHSYSQIARWWGLLTQLQLVHQVGCTCQLYSATVIRALPTFQSDCAPHGAALEDSVETTSSTECRSSCGFGGPVVCLAASPVTTLAADSFPNPIQSAGVKLYNLKGQGTHRTTGSCIH